MDTFNLNKKLEDESHWLQGYYNNIAFGVVMSHFGAGFGGKKSDAEYLSKPLLFEESEPKEDVQSNNEMIGAFEMAQRMKILKDMGLPESPK